MANPEKPVSETHPWSTLGFRLIALIGLVPVAAKLLERIAPNQMKAMPLVGKVIIVGLLIGLVGLSLSLIVNRFQQMGHEAKARQQERDAAAQQIAAALRSPWVKTAAFAFYVRPFFSDDRFAWETTDIGGDDAVRYGFRVAIEDMLARAIEPDLQLVALSGKGIGFGPGEISGEDAAWQKNALLLMERASIIFALPFTQPSTFKELQIILSSAHIEKTIFVVPPLYRPPLRSGPIRNSFLGRKAHPLEIYRESHKILSGIAPDMPLFAKSGGIFWREPDGWRPHPFKRREDWTEASLRSVLARNERLTPLLG